ncbi:hAT dimerization domain-containing protein / transposase-related [Zea mays]|uniref:HAT dimerization domain-containing protein / transposase-related n=1 Tax=Zea mays TaxID=4577 RepID=A0A1D6JY51_MAIZE|nr:hAT dimerization domain-containing protein / transposase-related [Zea mays]
MISSQPPDLLDIPPPFSRTPACSFTATSELPEFLGGSCTCSDKGGCLGSNKGPWNDPYILKLIHNLEVGCMRETTKPVYEGGERSSSSFRLEQMKWQGMLSDTSNDESGSDVDDFGPSFVHKVSGYGCLTPVREEVKGTDCATYLSCDDQSHPDMVPEFYHGVQRTTEMVQKQMADFRQYSTNGRPRDLGGELAPGHSAATDWELQRERGCVGRRWRGLPGEMTEGQYEETASAPEGVSVLRRNSDDVGWEYGVLVDVNNKDKVKCILCDKQMCGGVYRLKQHIAQEGKNAKKCQGMKTTKEKLLEAQEKCKKALDGAKRKREVKTVRELELREEVHVSRVGGSEEVTCVGSSEPHKLGPMDKWTKAIDPTATKSESLTQQRLNKELWKERLHEVHKYIARWAFNHVGQFGPGIEPPTMFDLRGRLLEEEYARTKSLPQEREAEKMKNGCSIMTDAWSDKKRRSIMNVCTNCADGTSFISSKEMSDVSYTSEVIFELVDKAIEDIGLDDVVQVVTDNASNNMGAKKLLHVKRPHIFWTSCATHTINLMLQGIGNMPRFKKVIDQAKAFTIFVYGHTRTLECMRYFTEGKEIKFQNREGPFSKKLARTFENFDYNPASWWRLYGTETPALQKMATKILSLTTSSSGCERNWSGFDGVHTKKRNRLTTDRLNKLVYIQFNNRLINKRAKIKSKKITDVLLSSGTTEAQGFLQEN